MLKYYIQRGLWWVLVQLLLLLVVFGGGFLWSHHWQSGASRVFGWLLVLVGAGCGVAGALSLGKNLSPFPHPASASALVTRGVYRLMRHPLYTAVFCGSLGWAMLQASWPATVAALCLGPFLDAKARVEEKALRQRFPDYAEYQRRVKRFIPGVY